MKKTIIKLTALALLAVMVTSCYGTFRLTSKIHDWNGEVSDSKFVNELVFVAMCVIPVYEVCALGDALIFNSIEFWAGNDSNPIAMQNGDVEEFEIMQKGQKFIISRSNDNMTIVNKESKEVADFKYFTEDNRWYQMDGDAKLMAVQPLDPTYSKLLLSLK